MHRYFGNGTKGYFISLMLQYCLGSVDDGTKGLLLSNCPRIFGFGELIGKGCLFVCLFDLFIHTPM